MTKAVEAGIPKQRIEDRPPPPARPAWTRAEDVVVGVNKYKLAQGGGDRHPRRR